MTEKKYQILTELRELLSGKLKDNLKDVVLFGSQLKESKSQDSDYDILILLHKTSNWKLEREISDLCYEIDLKYGIITDVHILPDDDLKSPRGKQPIFINAIANGFHA